MAVKISQGIGPDDPIKGYEVAEYIIKLVCVTTLRELAKYTEKGFVEAANQAWKDATPGSRKKLRFYQTMYFLKELLKNAGLSFRPPPAPLAANSGDVSCPNCGCILTVHLEAK